MKYPRTIKKDILLLKKLKIDILYMPNTKDIYPNGVNKKIKINSFSKRLCGKNRKGHFGTSWVCKRFSVCWLGQ